MNEKIKAGQWFEPHLVFPNKYQTGMTLRDYFAAKAMQSLIIAEHSKNEFNEIQAVMAYEVADAMLKERIKQ